MHIDYEEKSNKFVIKCLPNENHLMNGMPDRRWRKASRTWAAPALRRNIEFMRKHLSNTTMYTQKALEVYNKPIGTGVKSTCAFPPWFEYKTFQPMKHQKETLDKAYGLDEYAILFEQGLGKTFTAISLATAWRMDNQIDAVVVICPSSIKLVWEQELETHCPVEYQYHAIMAGKYKPVDKFIKEKTDFQWLVVGVEGLSQGGAHEYVDRFLSSRRCLIVIDESSAIKTPNKTRTDRCIDFGKLAAKRLILSGTAITQGVEDFYTQFKFLNPDIIGFNSYFTYRANYCVTINQEVGFKNGRPVTVPKIIGYQNIDELTRSVAPYTSRVEKEHALDLPEKIYQRRYITMSPAQKKAYTEMKQELYIECGGQEYEVDTVLEQMLRLMQITGGFYPHDNGETIEPRPLPGKNPKIEELKSLMDEISGKVVIWCQFRCEIDEVAKTLRKMGHGVVEFHGGCDDIEKKYAVKSFREDPEVKVFLATRAASRGLTLIEASTAIYYSLGYSLEDYAQSQDRIHRIGQKDSCNYIHLVCDRTVDIKALDALESKRDTAQMVYDSIRLCTE